MLSSSELDPDFSTFRDGEFEVQGLDSSLSLYYCNVLCLSLVLYRKDCVCLYNSHGHVVTAPLNAASKFWKINYP